MSAHRSLPEEDGSRIIICDYNALLKSVTGLLRMSGYRVFEAYDALAVEELCRQLTHIDLLILNTFGSGVDTGELIRRVRDHHPEMPCLHIGNHIPDGLPANVPSLDEEFNSVSLLAAVDYLVNPK